VVAGLRRGGTRGDDDSDSVLAESGGRFRLLPPVEVSPTAMVTIGAAIETSGPSQFWLIRSSRAVRARATFVRMDSAVAVHT
jgi:hypothetical protein